MALWSLNKALHSCSSSSLRPRGATEHMDTSGATEHRASGATEHRAERWQGALASANIGLPGNTFTGQKWISTHAPQLHRQCIELLGMPDVLGLCLCEVGSIDEPITAEGKKRMTAVLQRAFENTFGSSSLEGTPKSHGPRRRAAPPALHGEEMFE